MQACRQPGVGWPALLDLPPFIQDGRFVRRKAMQLSLLKTKIHRATVTHSELNYEGSIAIDDNLLQATGIREFEQVHIWDVTNGARFSTYAIRAEAGSGIISVNGAAAHKARVGDLVIICAYGVLDQARMDSFQPTLVYVDGDNRVRERKSAIAVQTR